MNWKNKIRVWIGFNIIGFILFCVLGVIVRQEYSMHIVEKAFGCAWRVSLAVTGSYFLICFIEWCFKPLRDE